MPSTPAPAGWPARVASLRAYLRTHDGRFPPTQAPEPEIADLAQWWSGVVAGLAELTPAQLDDVEVLRELATRLRAEQSDVTNPAVFADRVAQLRTHIEGHDGRFPTNRAADLDVARLGSWWGAVSLTANKQRMTQAQRDALDELRARAAQLRGQAKARRDAATAAANAERNRAGIRAAGARGAKAAAEALKSPHLIPGDAEVLRLRIAHPDLSHAELAVLAGMTHSQYAAKYFAARHRTANSRTPLRKALPERVLTPREAAELLGQPQVLLARWTRAGLVAEERTAAGYRQYRGAEILRVKGLFTDGVPAEFERAGVPSRRRRRR